VSPQTEMSQRSLCVAGGDSAPPYPASNPPVLALPVHDPRSTSISACSSGAYPALGDAWFGVPSRGSAGVEVAPRWCKAEGRESQASRPYRVHVKDCCWRWPSASSLASGGPVLASAAVGSASSSAAGPHTSYKLWSPSSWRLVSLQGSPPASEGSFLTSVL
jgi:hypothetical protein